MAPDFCPRPAAGEPRTEEAHDPAGSPPTLDSPQAATAQHRIVEVLPRPEWRERAERRRMRLIGAPFLGTPWHTSWQTTPRPRRKSRHVGHKRIRQHMRKIGLATVCQRPRTFVMHPRQQACTYLLCDLAIAWPINVGCTALTYI
jgi:hypothetical protein